MITQGILTIIRDDYNRVYNAFFADSIEELAQEYTGIDVWQNVSVGEKWQQDAKLGNAVIIRFSDNILLYRPDGIGRDKDRIAFVVDVEHPVISVIN